jgi:hypothetical protein
VVMALGPVQHVAVGQAQVWALLAGFHAAGGLERDVGQVRIAFYSPLQGVVQVATSLLKAFALGTHFKAQTGGRLGLGRRGQGSPLLTQGHRLTFRQR